MEAEILSTSNSRKSRVLESICIYSIILILTACQPEWYRKLPEPREEGSSKNYTGVWTKKPNPRSAINSSWHKNEWFETIEFRSDSTFTKTYRSKDWIGTELTERFVEGKGTYSVQKNWILLLTKQIRTEEKRSGQLEKNLINESESSLIYYYYKEKNLIIPMIYEMGYEEKNFGVKDGVKVPYDENNPNFFHFIKIYAFKEYQSHAYYPGN
ncbi:MAG: hypothetical protein IPL26_28040 [Leptospiraceae bacterium]|nr:hypothetical protein [Leptospiraceae bacterium]